MTADQGFDECWFAANEMSYVLVGCRFCEICNGVGLIVWDVGTLRVADGSCSRFWSTICEIRVEGMIL